MSSWAQFWQAVGMAALYAVKVVVAMCVFSAVAGLTCFVLLFAHQWMAALIAFGVMLAPWLLLVVYVLLDELKFSLYWRFEERKRKST